MFMSDCVLLRVPVLGFCQGRDLCKVTGPEYEAAGQMGRCKPL